MISNQNLDCITNILLVVYPLKTSCVAVAVVWASDWTQLLYSVMILSRVPLAAGLWAGQAGLVLTQSPALGLVHIHN